MEMRVWRSGSEWEEVVGCGGTGLRWFRASAVTSNETYRQVAVAILSHTEGETSKKKLYDQAVQKLKDQMLCFNTSFQRTRKR